MLFVSRRSETFYFQARRVTMYLFFGAKLLARVIIILVSIIGLVIGKNDLVAGARRIGLINLTKILLMKTVPCAIYLALCASSISLLVKVRLQKRLRFAFWGLSGLFVLTNIVIIGISLPTVFGENIIEAMQELNYT